MTETSAIFAYLGRKHNLCGSTEEARIRNDMIYSVTTSNRSAFVSMCYNKEHEKMKGPFLESLGGRLEKYSQSLGKHDFFGGSELVYADLCVYDLLDIWNQFEPGCVEKHDNLKAYLARIEAIPSIKKFLESEAGMKKGPFNNKIAQWGN
ncbi:GSTM3 [Bugula neritina]|uniref:glutathione transferase n=1 Tax=Bugula neritina TaxID=10212 RepID=A0A7J7J8V6_BUGNE|nr:GSTM3 [Bugula neritina]